MSIIESILSLYQLMPWLIRWLQKEVRQKYPNLKESQMKHWDNGKVGGCQLESWSSKLCTVHTKLRDITNLGPRRSPLFGAN